MGGLYFERDGGALVIMQKKVCENDITRLGLRSIVAD